MIGRVVEIASEGQHLTRHRGFLVIRKDGVEQGRVPLDDIAVLLCGPDGPWPHLHQRPAWWTWRTAASPRCFAAATISRSPGSGRWKATTSKRSACVRSWKHPLPLRKRLWQALVKAKIAQQQNVLELLETPGGGLAALARRVRSGDPDNIEAQAARRYWPLVFGPAFRRDRSGAGPNPFLNYGYTVLRAAVARSVAAAGLHPSIGIHHHNRANPFCLVDDLMEPFRPLVDYTVAQAHAGRDARRWTSEAKRSLAGVLVMDLRTERGTTPLRTCIERAAQSAAQSYESCKPVFTFPGPPLVDSYGDAE